MTDRFSGPSDGGDNVALGVSGQCQVILGGRNGTSFPCATIASYAKTLLSTCGTKNASTGGMYFPNGAVLNSGTLTPEPNGDSEQAFPVYIALAQSGFAD